MLNSFISLDMSVRMLCVLLVSLVAARFANWGIYSWAHFSRRLGPWTAGMPASPRTWADHIPVYGWWLLRREASLHGVTYWLRPLLIELMLPLAMVWYYRFVMVGGTLPAPYSVLAKAIQPDLHGQFLGHFILIVLMTIATFIDFDEQSIPDYVTVPGTILGLSGAALVPGWMGVDCFTGLPLEMQALSPEPWQAWLNANWGLYFAIAIIAMWTFALLDRRLILRRGWAKAIQYFFAGMFRHPWLWKAIVVIGVLLGLSIFLVWQWQLVRWQYLLSSLFGLACAGGITWAVRIVASAALRAQALGFGDVTLMAMIGTFVGWQASLLIFFMAPLMAVVIVVLQYLITREKAAPYGPYLCAATMAVLVKWEGIWSWAAGVFSTLGSVVLVILVTCVVVMGALLWMWRLIRDVIWSARKKSSDGQR